MLTAPEVQKLSRTKLPEKMTKVYDERGLYLEVPTSGSLRWRFKYRVGGKEKLISLGIYPDVSLADAREKREEARRLHASGVDPSAARKAEKESSSGSSAFEAIAREWETKQAAAWKPSHGDRILGRLEKWIFPYVGARAPDDIDPQELLKALRRIESTGAIETAHRALRNCGQVFRYAIATGRATKDPTPLLKGALQAVQVKNHPALIEPAALGALLRAMDGFQGGATVRVALKLMPLVFVRPFNLRAAEWAEMDLDGATWTIPKHKLKMNKVDLVVPLARQSVDLLRDVQVLSGNGQWVFPQVRGKKRPMSDGTLKAALAQIGYASTVVVPHGFRATARTLLDENLKFRPDWIEHQLNHEVRDSTGRAYNRTTFLDDRRVMMQRWADYLDELKANGT